MKKPKIPKQYLGAFKAGHRLPAREYIDEELSYELLNKIIDSNYTDSEAMKALEYITKFNNEYYKNVIKKGDTTALHNTDKLRRDCYSREHARNRDIYPKEHKNFKSLNDPNIELHLNKNRSTNHEDVVIELLDLKNEAQKSDKH